jgi:hypothetical protein
MWACLQQIASLCTAQSSPKKRRHRAVSQVSVVGDGSQLASTSESTAPEVGVVEDDSQIMLSPGPFPGGCVFTIKVVKQREDEKMGITPSKGTVHVRKLNKDGAIHRTNMENGTSGGPILQVDDTIIRVNSVDEDAAQMVAECRSKNELIMQVFRPKRGSSSASTSCASSVSGPEEELVQEFEEQPEPELKPVEPAARAVVLRKSVTFACSEPRHLRSRRIRLAPVLQSRHA